MDRTKHRVGKKPSHGLSRRDFLHLATFGIPGMALYHPKEAIDSSRLDRNVHIFYYPWWANPKFNGEWYHWNLKGHRPAADLASDYFPLLGAYSTSDPAVVRQHMRWISQARIGVICLSFWGKHSFEDLSTPLILDTAQRFNVKVNFHIEPYAYRRQSFIDDILYLLDEYGQHPAFYRTEEQKPLFYIFKSTVGKEDRDYISDEEWNFMLYRLRLDSRSDSVFLGQTTDLGRCLRSGFDGVYTYGVDTVSQWEEIGEWFHSAGLLWSPSILPGYIDYREKAYTGEKTRYIPREDGNTYDRMAEAAISSQPDILTITSFNEFHEGTQIEPAMRFLEPMGYLNYYPQSSLYYIRATRRIIEHWQEVKNKKITTPSKLPSAYNSPSINAPGTKSPRKNLMPQSRKAKPQLKMRQRRSYSRRVHH
ncbi:MAG: hypothetical protein OEX80_02580 [Candidatus Aminicenantes bacterium]|nr:hypothetical protein [Candidatus Aminicenantes bacterium]